MIRFISSLSQMRRGTPVRCCVCRWRGSYGARKGRSSIAATSTLSRKESSLSAAQASPPSSPFFEPSRVFWLDLPRSAESSGGLRRHRVLEWTRTVDGHGDGDEPRSGASPYIAFFHANSVGPGPWAPIVRRLFLAHDDEILPTCVAVESRGHGDTQVAPGNLGAPLPLDNPDLDDDGIHTNDEYYRWELFADDFARIAAALAARYGGPPRAVVTHSFAGDCALLSLAREKTPSLASAPSEAPAPPPPRLILLDPVLADAEGAARGAARLARGTRRLGEREAASRETFGATSSSVCDGYQRVLAGSGMLHDEGAELDAEAMRAFAAFAIEPCNRNDDEEGSTVPKMRLKCRRSVEASIYKNRVSLGDVLHDRDLRVDADVQLVFSSRRRGKREDQSASFERDWRQAERVISRCTQGSSKLHLLQGVGHFLTLENPELVAATLNDLLTNIAPT